MNILNSFGQVKSTERARKVLNLSKLFPDKGQLAEQRRSRSRSRETTPVGNRENVTIMGEMVFVPKAGKPWFVQLPSQEVTLREGDPLNLKCQIDGDPRPAGEFLIIYR